MPTEKELMLKQADAETTYQKKLTAGTNITIDPVTNIISSAGGGSTVQYTDNTPNGESVGILAINGQSHPVRIPKLSEGTGITINKDITTNVYTISLSGGGGGTTKTYMGETNPDELVGEDGDLYFKYHKITTVIPTELTLPSLPDDTVVPFPITNFNSYDSFTFYCTDPSLQTTTINLNIGDIPIGDNPAELTPESEIHRFNTFYYAQVSRSTDGEGLVFRVGRNVLFKLEANVTEIDLGIDKSYAKVEDTWLPSGEQVEANPEETSETPLTKIKIDGVTYYIAAGGSAEIVPLTKAEWDALPASKYTDDILYLITDSFTTETIITPNPEGEATDTLTKLQIDETIYSLAGGSGAAAVEKTQSEYNALTPAQKENGAIYMVQGEAEIIDTPIDMSNITSNIEVSSIMSVSSTTDTTTVTYNRGGTGIGCVFYYTNKIDLTTINQVKFGLETGDNYHQADSPQNPIHIGFCSTVPSGFSPTFDVEEEYYLRNHTYDEQDCVIDTSELTGEYYLTVVSHGWNLVISDFILEGTGEVLENKIYYMGTEYANTNGGSGGGDGYKLEKIFDGNVTTAGNITLTKSLDNYDELVFVMKQSSTYIRTDVIPIEFIKNIASYSTTHGVMIKDYSGYHRYFIVDYVDNTTLDITVIENTTLVEIYGVKHSAGCGGGGTSEGEGVEIYSENEYIVGRWIDGKKLYQKTIKFSATSLSKNWMTIEQGVDYNLAFPEVQGLYYTSNGEPFTQSTRVFVQNGDLKIQPLNELDLLSSTLKHVITIRYTKTVETPAPAWGGSVTNNYANFIDTDNVIQAETQVSSGTTGTYTATEDCYIRAKLWRSSEGGASLSIDGVEVLTNYSNSGTTALYNTIPLKKGQTATIDAGAGSPCSYTVYGIDYGSGGSSSESSIEYSTEEKEVGTWIDGSKIYQKTFVLSSFTSGTITINASDLNIKNLVDANGEADFIQNDEIVESLKLPHYISGQANSTIRMAFGNIQILHTGLNEYTNGYVTIQYTKTTD